MGFFSDIAQSFVKSNPIGQAINLFSSGITSAINAHSQKETNKRNAEQNELNRQFSAEEAAKNRQFQADQNVLQNQYNLQQANAAFERSAQFQKEMWEKENEYNSPSAQVQRLVDAGFNPNLFGGDNTAMSAGSASSPAASGSAPSGSAASAPSSIPMQSYSVNNPLLEASQIRLNNAQSAKLGSDTDFNKAQINRINELLSGEKEEQRLRIDTSKWNLENLSPAQLRNLEANTNFVSKEASSLDEQVRYLQAQIKMLGEQQNLVGEQIRRAKIENKNLDDILKSEIRKNLLSGDLMVGQKQLSEEQANYYAQEATNAILNGGCIAIEYNKAKSSQSAEINIKSSENAYLQSLNDWKANNPRMAIMMEEAGQMFGAIGRGVGSAVGIIGRGLIPK